jgi:hypothetical protein
MIYLASCLFFISYVFFYVLLYPYHDLRWYARVLVNLPLTCLSHQMLVLGQQPWDLMGSLQSFHHRYVRLRRP